jgi:alkylhydroperoxidase family enzyme
MARVPLCTEHDLSEPYRDMFKRTVEARALPLSNLVRALAHIPAVLEKRTAYSNSLRHDTKLPRRDCELAILTVGHFTDCRYEFVHHVEPGIAAGLRREQIRALDDFATSPEFDDRERAIVRYAHEATLKIKVSDATWNAVAAHLDRERMLELVLIVAWYNQTVRVLEPLQVDLEEKYRGWEGV